MADRKSINALIEDLQAEHKTKTIGGFIFKELTLAQQRNLAKINFSEWELNVRISNFHNKNIKDSVVSENDVASLGGYVTVAQKPFFINVLRTITLGNEIVKDNEKYTLYDVVDSDLTDELEEVDLKRGKTTIHLRVPVLDVDTKYNGQLVQDLARYKKTRVESATEGEMYAIFDLYRIYEIMKYIDYLEVGGSRYPFEEVSIADQKRILDSMSAGVIEEIETYIKQVRALEEKAYTAVSKTGQTVLVNQTDMFATNRTLENEET